MKRTNLKFVFILALFTSCATTKKETFGLEDKTLNDQVSVQTVLMQAHAAYLRGCIVERQLMMGKKKSYKMCKKKADSYLETEVVSILKQ